MKTTVLSGALAALALSAAPANAVDLTFTISGDYSAQFILPESPAVDPTWVVDGNNFAITGVPGFAESSNGKGALVFFNKDFGGGLLIADDGDPFFWLFDATDGNQYYSGAESAPTFLAGTYLLEGLSTRGNFTLTIAAAGGAVPEPASWAMMIGGFALAGAAMRRPRKTLAIRFEAV